MKATFRTGQLKHALEVVHKVVPARSALPILMTQLLEIKDGVGNLYGTDLACGIKKPINFVTCSEPGSVIFDSKKIFDYVSLLTSEVVCFESDNTHLTISNEESTAKFAILENVDEFPNEKFIENENESTYFEGIDLVNALKYVMFSASDDNTREMLTGIHFVWDDGRLKLVSTDTHRMSCVSTDLNECHLKFTIYKKHLQAVMPSLFGECELSMDNQFVCIKTEDCTMFIQSFAGKYPNFKKVIPEKYESKILIANLDLLQCLKRASIIAKDCGYAIKLKFNKEDSSITISANFADSSFEETIPMIAGSDLEIEEIYLDAKYLLEVISVTKRDIEFCLSGNASALMIRFGQNPDYVHILMPRQAP